MSAEEDRRMRIQNMPSGSFEFHSHVKDESYIAASLSTIRGIKGPRKQLPNQDTFNYQVVDKVPWSESSVLVTGVFDGHGKDGHHVSKFVSARLVEEICKEAFRYARRSDFRDYGILRAFERVDAAVRARADTQDSGTTAVVAVVCYEEIILANVGDSGAAFMFRDGTVRYVTRDHSPDDARERRRINRVGGAVRNCQGTFRVFNVVAETGELDGGLALSRAFGDLSLETAGVVSSPDITSFPFGMRAGPDGWRERPVLIILGSDGLWDVVDEAAIPHLIAESNSRSSRKATKPLSAATSLIAKHARDCWMVDTKGEYVDDITVMSIFLSYEDVVLFRDEEEEEEEEEAAGGYSPSRRRRSTTHRLEKLEARKEQTEAMTSEEVDRLIKRCMRDSNDCAPLGRYSVVHETLLSRKEGNRKSAVADLETSIGKERSKAPKEV